MPISNFTQVGQAPKLKNRLVITPGILDRNGEPCEFLVWQITQGDLAEFREGDQDNSDIRFLAKTIRDEHNNPIWPSVEKAIVQLSPFPSSSLQPLIRASNELLFSAATADAEKNSEETKSESSPSS